MFRNLIYLTAAASLAPTPVLAQAAPPPAAELSTVSRAAAAPGDSELTGGSWIAPVLFAVIVIAGILTAAGVIFDDDPPASP